MTQHRDWKKDMEICEQYERDEGWSRRDLIAEQPQMTMYWLQEAKKWREEALRQYPTPEAYEAACAALEKHRGRADAAEVREQRLKEAMNKIEDETRDEWIGVMIRDLLSTLYPDTPAPTAAPTPEFTARPIDEWHEDYGDVLWWTFPIQESPYCGSPLDIDWPDYHTHWTPLVLPATPAPKEGE